MDRITVYHGSLNNFKSPSLEKSKNYRDFGNGFYITEEYSDALGILKRKEGFVMEYKLSLEGLSILELTGDVELAEYIYKNRTEIFKDEYDVVVGKTVPNCSEIFKQVRLHGKEVSIEEIVALLGTSPYQEQWCLKTERAINNLEYVSTEEFSKEDFTF